MPPDNHSSLKGHPRYDIRRCMILSAIIGIGLTLNSDSFYDSGPYAYSGIIFIACWLFGSVVICFWDLLDWRLKQAAWIEKHARTLAERQPLLISTTDTLPDHVEDGGDDNGGDGRDTPRIIIILLDLAFCVILGMLWFASLAYIIDNYGRQCYYGHGYGPGTINSVVWATYATMTVLFNAVCHALCFWKQTIAMKKSSWNKALGRKRQEWEEHLNKYISTAIHTVARSENADSNTQMPSRCTCACSHTPSAENFPNWAKNEGTFVNRLIRVLHQNNGYEPIGKIDEEATPPNNADHNNAPGKQSKSLNTDLDIEAGPSYPHNTLRILTPSHTVSDTETNDTVTDTKLNADSSTRHLTTDLPSDTYNRGRSPPTNPNPNSDVNTLIQHLQFPYSYKSPASVSVTSERTASGDVEAVLVKKKYRGRNLRLEKERERQRERERDRAKGKVRDSERE